MMSVRALDAGYGPVQVLRGVGIDVGEREVVAVLGANGAGKSTLNGVISGLIRPKAGTVTFDGEDITGLAPARIVARGLVQVPEGRKLFPNLSVRENLEMGSYRRGKSNRSKNMEEVLDIFPRLRGRLRQAAGTLSGGEQQMLAIGRGLMAEPRLLILDEPSLGLSPLLVEQMFALIKQINGRGFSVLLVEQNVVQSLAIADRAYVMEDGTIGKSGTADEMANDPELRRAYLGI